MAQRPATEPEGFIRVGLGSWVVLVRIVGDVGRAKDEDSRPGRNIQYRDNRRELLEGK
jgi:hypothetical protein